ncbi:MAG TPA: hypothetical protein V6C81_19575 [Planktothrix sp.]
MAIDMITGEWFSMGELMKGMTPEQQRSYLDATGKALNDSISKMEQGEAVDIAQVNRVITGRDVIDQSPAPLETTTTLDVQPESRSQRLQRLFFGRWRNH